MFPELFNEISMKCTRTVITTQVLVLSLSGCTQSLPDPRDVSIALSKCQSTADIDRIKLEFLTTDVDEKHFANMLEWAAIRNTENSRFEPIEITSKKSSHFIRLVRPAEPGKSATEGAVELLLAKALEIRVQHPDDKLSVLRMNFGQAKMEVGDYKESEILLNAAQKEISKSPSLFNNLNLNVLVRNRLGTLYMRTNRLEEAKKQLLPLESICTGAPPKRVRTPTKGQWNQSTPDFAVQTETLETLSELFELQGDLKKALLLQRKVVTTIRTGLEEEARLEALAETNGY